MPIVRIERAERRRWVTVSVETVEDQRIPLDAKGLWLYLMSRPATWQVRIGHLAAANDTSEYAIRKMLQALQDVQLARLETIRNDDGTLAGKEWIIFEEPHEDDRSDESADVADDRRSQIADIGDFDTLSKDGIRNSANTERESNSTNERPANDQADGAREGAGSAGGLPFHPDQVDDQGEIERSDLAGRKVPLSQDERELYGEQIAHVWKHVQRGVLEDLYRLTFGERGPGRSKLMPRGTEFRIMGKLGTTYPWEWLVPAFVVASAKRAPMASVEKFIAVWLEKLAPATGQANEDPLPFHQAPAAPSVRLPDPPTDSYTVDEREWMDADYGLDDAHWNELETNEGTRWMLNEKGRRKKQDVITERRSRKAQEK